MSNRIKYNLKKVHYAKHIIGADGAVTFSTPVPIPGAVNLALDAQGDIKPFYADGIVFYKSASNNGYEGDLEVALVPESFRVDILGETLDAKKVMVENAYAKQSPFALLFEFDGDENPIRHVLYNCTATRASVESKTKEDSTEPVTEKFTVSATPMENGDIKARTAGDTEAATHEGWYKAVYRPTKTGGETNG